MRGKGRPMFGKGLPRQMRVGDVTVSPILGTDGIYVYGEVVDQRVHGCRYIPLGFSDSEGQAVAAARELCRVDGQGRVWLFGRAGCGVEVGIRRGRRSSREVLSGLGPAWVRAEDRRRLRCASAWWVVI